MNGTAVTSGLRIKKYVDVIYLIVLFLYMAETACSMVFVTPFFCGYYSHIAPFLFLAIAIYKLVTEYGKNKKRAVAAAVFILFSLGISFLIRDDLAFATLAFAMTGALGVNADRVIGCGIAGNIVMVISNIITSFIVDPTSLNSQIQERNFFYLKDPLFVPKINNRSSTDLATHYFWMIAAYMWIRGKKITWGEIFALTALTAVVYSLTGSTNLLLCCGLLLAYAFVIKVFHKITEAENNSFVSAVRKTVFLYDICCCFNNPVSIIQSLKSVIKPLKYFIP